LTCNQNKLTFSLNCSLSVMKIIRVGVLTVACFKMSPPTFYCVRFYCKISFPVFPFKIRFTFLCTTNPKTFFALLLIVRCHFLYQFLFSSLDSPSEPRPSLLGSPITLRHTTLSRSVLHGLLYRLSDT